MQIKHVIMMQERCDHREVITDILISHIFSIICILFHPMTIKTTIAPKSTKVSYSDQICIFRLGWFEIATHKNHPVLSADQHFGSTLPHTALQCVHNELVLITIMIRCVTIHNIQVLVSLYKTI